jgi:hypothetical protein
MFGYRQLARNSYSMSSVKHVNCRFPGRECKMQGFKSTGSTHQFLPFHAAYSNTFNVSFIRPQPPTRFAFFALALNVGCDSIDRVRNFGTVVLHRKFANVAKPRRAA